MSIKTEKIVLNEIGEEIHIFYDELGNEVGRAKDYHAADHLFSGVEFCPNCRTKCKYENGNYICKKCGYSISDKNAEDGYGYPTLEATYEDDFDF